MGWQARQVRWKPCGVMQGSWLFRITALTAQCSRQLGDHKDEEGSEGEGGEDDNGDDELEEGEGAVKERRSTWGRGEGRADALDEGSIIAVPIVDKSAVKSDDGAVMSQRYVWMCTVCSGGRGDAL